jgi:outer membrane protein OmpA-like peptidoglycan-associated protein
MMDTQMAQTRFTWRHLAAFSALSLLAACAQPYGGQPYGGHVDVAPPMSNPPPVPPGPGATWYHVPFASGSYAIDPDAQTTITAVTVYLQQNPNSIATIIGQTDSVGSPQYNMHLSHLRADTVRNALVYDGKIDATRVETRWTGATGNGGEVAASRVVDIAIH